MRKLVKFILQGIALILLSIIPFAASADDKSLTIEKETAALAVVVPDDFNKGNLVMPQEALIGKVAGMSVVPESGDPGSSDRVIIRGGSSLYSLNEPLYVVDGLPISNSLLVGHGNILSIINPDDIESFTILKDAVATAIYGNKAVNGAILITTKKGTAKTTVNYSGNFSASTAKRVDVLSASEYRDFVKGVPNIPIGAKLGNANTDWQDEIYQAAFGMNHALSVGGTIAPISTPYRVSIGYTDQNGVIRTNKYQRYNFAGSISPVLLDKHLRINLNARVAYDKSRLIDENVVSNAVRFDPTRPVYTGSNTASTDMGLGYYISTGKLYLNRNPVAMLNLQDIKNNVVRSIGNLAIDYNIHGLEDLSLHFGVGYDISCSEISAAIPDLSGISFYDGLEYYSRNDKRNYNIDVAINYDHTFAGKHHIWANTRYNRYHYYNDYNAKGECKNIPRQKMGYNDKDAIQTVCGASVGYDFNGEYLVSATLTSDSYDIFFSDDQKLFPTFGAAWNINKASFLKDITAINNLKLRINYGKSYVCDYMLRDYNFKETDLLGEFINSFKSPQKAQWGLWKKLKPETVTKWNAGIDYAFFDNRLSGSIEYFNNKTEDLINVISYPSMDYPKYSYNNGGTLNHEGFELAVNATPIRTKDIEWTIGLTYSYNSSKITDLGEYGIYYGDYLSTNFFSFDGESPYTYHLAQQVYDIHGKPVMGQYIQPDGSMSPDKTIFSTGKSSLPTSLIGLNMHLRYKNFDFAFSGHGAFGNYVYNYFMANQSFRNVYYNSIYSNEFSNVHKDFVNSEFKTETVGTDVCLENASFFKFDNITVGYTFRQLWNNGSKLRLTFGVENIATITGYSGADPEIIGGRDYTGYRQPRTYTLGVNLSF